MESYCKRVEWGKLVVVSLADVNTCKQRNDHAKYRLAKQVLKTVNPTFHPTENTNSSAAERQPTKKAAPADAVDALAVHPPRRAQKDTQSAR